jgi:hypothetical protein
VKNSLASTIILHTLRTRNELPDVTGGIPCCYGSAHNGPGGCTCWVPIYDSEQSPLQDGPVAKRNTMCEDCAYRKNSPERSGLEGYSGDEDMLMEIVYTGEPFYCHQGMRRVIAYRHPCGFEIPAPASDYAPPLGYQVPLKADGTLADICGGWCAQRSKFEKVCKEQELLEMTREGLQQPKETS